MVARPNALENVVLPVEMLAHIASFTENTKESRGALACTCTILFDLCREVSFEEEKFSIYPITAEITAYRHGFGLIAKVTAAKSSANIGVGENIYMHPDKNGHIESQAKKLGLLSPIGMEVVTTKARRNLMELFAGVDAKELHHGRLVAGGRAKTSVFFQQRVWPEWIKQEPSAN